jgi:hypothetical protein
VSTSARSLGNGREKGKSSEEECGCENILEFSLCRDMVKATSNKGATDGAMLCKSYEF